MITEALAGQPATVGFRSRTSLDESAETRQKTRLAVARAKEGDREALRFLYVSYSDNVYGYVRIDRARRPRGRGRDAARVREADDGVVKYDDRGVPFFAWLLRLARNVAIDHLRANRLTPTERGARPATSVPSRTSTAREPSGRRWPRCPTSSARSSCCATSSD